MKRTQFSVEQIVAVLKQAELGPRRRPHPPPRDCEQTVYRWKQRYAGLESEQVWEFK